MRKYFLLGAVAMLMTTTANSASTPDYADIQVSAEVGFAQKLDCTNIDFGTIILKSDGSGDYVMLDPDALTYSKSSGIFSWSGYNMGRCDSDNLSILDDIDEGIYLHNTTATSSSSILFEPILSDNHIGGTLRFDAEDGETPVLAGKFVGSFTLVHYSEE